MATASGSNLPFSRVTPHHVAKILYPAKRVTRVPTSGCIPVQKSSYLAKLQKLMGYIRLSRTRGIMVRAGPTMMVKAYIDAA